jgi:hypothetical protein
MNDALERIWTETNVVDSRNYIGICFEGLRKTTENLNRDLR